MSGTDDFLDRCEDVLTDWEGSADSSRWHPDLPEDADADLIEGEELPWPPGLRLSARVHDAVAHGGMVLHPNDWTELGHIEADRVWVAPAGTPPPVSAMIRAWEQTLGVEPTERQRLVLDRLLTGSAYVDGQGRRVPPAHVPTLTLDLGHLRFPPESVVRLTRAVDDAMVTMKRTLTEVGRVASRVGVTLRDAGLLPDEPPTDPRKRALWARRNRSTGPARDPFRNRGQTRDHRPIQQRLDHSPGRPRRGRARD